MRLPAQLHKARNQRFRKRAADFEDRKPFERFPLWLRILSSLPLPVWYGDRELPRLHPRQGDEVAPRDHRHAARGLLPGPRRGLDRATRTAFYRNFADVSVEIIKAVTMKPEESHVA